MSSFLNFLISSSSAKAEENRAEITAQANKLCFKVGVMGRDIKFLARFKVINKIDENDNYYSTLTLNPEIKDIDDFKFEDIIVKYDHFHPAIYGAVSV